MKIMSPVIDQRGHRSVFRPENLAAKLDECKAKALMMTSMPLDKLNMTYSATDFSHCVYDCSLCGVRPGFYFSPSGDLVSSTECQFAKTDGLTVFRVSFPTGKVVVNDSLGVDLPEDTERSFAPYNSALGQQQVSYAMAELNVAYGAVGNTCPSVFLLPDGSFKIASVDKKPRGWVEIAGVTTDLWAYSLADVAFLEDGLGDPNRWSSGAVIEVPPGVYEFTHFATQPSFSFNSPAPVVVYAQFSRVSSSGAAAPYVV